MQLGPHQLYQQITTSQASSGSSTLICQVTLKAKIFLVASGIRLPMRFFQHAFRHSKRRREKIIASAELVARNGCLIDSHIGLNAKRLCRDGQAIVEN
uniref:Uncharacterized protein n=1 Tax=Cucumis melo TaxID=3656 RepID=A0A9I9E9C9_CUCME